MLHYTILPLLRSFSVGLVMAFRPMSSSTSMFSYGIENFSYLRSFIHRKYKALALKEKTHTATAPFIGP